MPQRYYPAVLERGPKDTFGAWFPNFPGTIGAAHSQEEAMAKAEAALADAVDELFLEGRALPDPIAIEKIEIPKGCDFVAFFAVGVEPPDRSERVNIYLPKSLLDRVDRLAADMGMSRSSFFGWAVSLAARIPPAYRAPPAAFTRHRRVAVKTKP